MRLKTYTDYGLRVMLMLASEPDRLITIDEIAERYRISRNHLLKVVQQLSEDGYVRTVRGRNGGVRLGRPPEEINVGTLIRAMEGDFGLVECLGEGHCACVIERVCRARRVITQALDNFFSTLEGVTLAEISPRSGSMHRVLFPAETR